MPRSAPGADSTKESERLGAPAVMFDVEQELAELESQQAGFKDVVGAGPYHSSYCDRNFVEILSEIIKMMFSFCRNSSECSNCFLPEFNSEISENR